MGNYGRPSFPVVPGYEYDGVLADVGPAVIDFSFGTGLLLTQTSDWARASPA